MAAEVRVVAVRAAAAELKGAAACSHPPGQAAKAAPLAPAATAARVAAAASARAGR